MFLGEIFGIGNGVGVFCTGKRGWVAYDTTFENAFFEFFQRRLSTHPTPGASCIPRRWRPQPPAHPDGLHSTGSGTGHIRCKADHARHNAHGAHARTLDTLHRSALDTRQGAAGRSGRRRGWRALSVSETVQIRTLERHAKTDLKIITILCMFVACATLQIH